MDIEATKTAATQLLDNYYQIHTSDLPTQRTKSQWQAENKRGFFLGIIQEGEDSHIIQLHHLLATNQFTQQQEFSTTSQLADPQHPRTFIDDMFARYILPFHKDYSDSSSCHTPLSSNPPSRSNSAEDLDYVPEEMELTHKDLKKAVEKRDGVCLFCWDKLQCHGAHIIAQKNIGMAYDEPSSLLARAGLTQKHQVQNGLLLCIKCHGEFDQLQQYVDVVDDKLVVKVVNHSVLRNDDKHRDWIDAVETLKDTRLGKQRRLPEFSSRQAVEHNGEMALYFVLNNPTELPNREALRFHKAACLIWRMAGGVESEDEHCPDDDDGYIPVVYRSKSIEKWIDSSATLVIESTQ
ncbi:hypothetical protein BC833DRAFT_543394 [Globomyces pollinis-pini]|nr:hypothetical protein BC833DRAFT_543394 [Globomyces pollinis-pini]